MYNFLVSYRLAPHLLHLVLPTPLLSLGYAFASELIHRPPALIHHRVDVSICLQNLFPKNVNLSLTPLEIAFRWVIAFALPVPRAIQPVLDELLVGQSPSQSLTRSSTLPETSLVVFDTSVAEIWFENHIT